jgi:hypothetical protein
MADLHASVNHMADYATTGPKVCRCGAPGTELWVGDGGWMAANHGMGEWRCELCVVKAQLEHAIQRAALIPVMKKRIAELEAARDD